MTASTKSCIPFVDLTEQFAALKEDIEAAFAPILSSGSFILGPAVEEFEKSFSEYCGTRFCVTVHNGTAALHLALLSLGIGIGDEVITAANGFVATAEAINFCGATPRFVDVDPITYNIDPLAIEKAINKKTKAIIPVHLYGQAADMDAVLALGQRYGLKVVEDACQAHGAIYKGKKVGGLGNIGCFSFYPGKNLGAAGDGGAVVTDDENIAQTIRLLRNHGSQEKYVHELVGHNFRLDTLQAAVLNVKLPYLDKWNAKRRKLADFYELHLKNIPGLITPQRQGDRNHIFHLYVIQVQDRDKVQAALQANGIGYGIHYPTPIHLQPAFQPLGFGLGSFPETERLMKHILSLPMFPELKEEQQLKVVDVLRKTCAR